LGLGAAPRVAIVDERVVVLSGIAKGGDYRYA
jgi:hypothetical protein